MIIDVKVSVPDVLAQLTVEDLQNYLPPATISELVIEEVHANFDDNAMSELLGLMIDNFDDVIAMLRPYQVDELKKAIDKWQ